LSGDQHPPLDPPEPVQAIVARLERAGFETWCVGGAVRDALLGHGHLDWDLATAARPAEVRRLFSRTVPLGIEFGTVGVLDDAGGMHEVTTFRRDVETDGRHAVVEFGASLEEDLARRDFTINAVAYSPGRRELRDPFGGRADLERGVIRAVGDPDERMREDRLRALRAIRFAARFGFTIEADTWGAIVRSAPVLGRLSAERVKQELEKTMEQVGRPSVALSMWRESGALAALVPALAGISEAALVTLDCLPVPTGPSRRREGRKVARLAALVLELDEGGVRQVLRGLRFSNAHVEWSARLVAGWREWGVALAAALSEGGPGVSDAVVRRLVAGVGRTMVASFLRLAAARWAGGRQRGEPGPRAEAVRALYRRALRVAYPTATGGVAQHPIERADLAVDGDDLRGAGIPPGRILGIILDRMMDEVIEDPSRNGREWLIARALELYRELTDSGGDPPEGR
jgi:tRNA nucleotidyltransferase/poly(A) polymerase